MNHSEWAQVGKVAQDGFTRLQQELVTAGCTDEQAITILLSTAQLKAHVAGIVIENTTLPGEYTLPGGHTLPGEHQSLLN